MVNPTPLMSMTGFAVRTGESAGWAWSWEVRSVNAKGLDLRLRLPEGCERVEAAARARLQAELARGAVSVTLKFERTGASAASRLDPQALGAALDALAAVETEAQSRGLTLAVPTIAEVLALRGVMDLGGSEAVPEEVAQAALSAIPGLIDDLKLMRGAEGARLGDVLVAQISRIEDLTKAAKVEADARRDDMTVNLKANLARVLQNSDGADPTRVAQELALIAVRADVTEELDRLAAHVRAARDLVASGQPIGRKLDFLMQEFLREANTLCSKSQSAPLTAIGLDLKVVIDQMREQVQNVE